MPISWNTAAQIGWRYAGTAAGIFTDRQSGAFLAPVVSGDKPLAVGGPAAAKFQPRPI